MSSFCSAKATHIFSAKNMRILYIESAKIVNEMTLNELVKLTTLWTTGPRCVLIRSILQRCFLWVPTTYVFMKKWEKYLSGYTYLIWTYGNKYLQQVYLKHMFQREIRKLCRGNYSGYPSNISSWRNKRKISIVFAWKLFYLLSQIIQVLML